MNKLFACLFVCAATLGFASTAPAATPEAKATYKAAEDSAAADYKIARAKCDSLTGNPKDVCIEEAKAAEKRSNAEAEAQFKHTLKARTSARIAMAEADYAVAKAKCGAMVGNDKDVCIKEAKAVETKAIADAKAHKKVAEAKTEAREDTRDAQYDAALEKCSALAGAAKDTCIASTKVQFGK
ncbi:hypothetical protein [Paraherbaspirillum soli]|uniref:Cell envelope biogenesis protein TolA n=1 Tax=Paraherbaspirillum soli TaxID=631222 RepID=A0ABW0M743_9BURK